MKLVDLHVHSDFSDGTCSPDTLADLAVRKGLSAIALTDHDTTAGIESAQAYITKKALPLTLIPGTELSTVYNGQEIHIVGLMIDPNNETLVKTTKEMIERRTRRNDEMAANLQKAGIPITIAALKAGNPDTVITRAHFAKFLVDTGVVKDGKEAFRKYLSEDCPYYVPRFKISAKSGIRLIRNAGGLPILAHPLHYKLPEQKLRTMLDSLKEAGLIGIEVKYSNHTAQDERFVRHLAKEYHLLPSGGSDFHGTNKPAIALGTGRGNLAVPYAYLEELTEYHMRQQNAT
ncbi:MAG: PHP domain-containing protein [Clostridiaceae bacterium]|nr:PHP domain-containing protein [Clostridiaceae bacterium]